MKNASKLQDIVFTCAYELFEKSALMRNHIMHAIVIL